MMRCPSCGADVSIGMRLCAVCGAEVTDPGAQTVALATDTSQDHDELLAVLQRELAKDYDFEGEVGRGGMAVVYKATELELRRSVAIKVLPPGVAARGYAERFKREARLIASLDHPAIIPIYRVGQAADTYYFAMKYVEGRALDAIIEAQGALPLPVILLVLRTTAGALAYAHEHGVVHRDIKGANILVDAEGRVLISDFGIARASVDKAITVTGSLMGTPYFMSPEACEGRSIGPPSDQYSLGILAFQMITGAVPFDADSLMGLMQHHCYSPVPDMTRVRDGLPEGLVQLVGRALAKDPGGRYPSTREMLAAVEAIPFADAERHEGEELVRQLARGNAIPEVRTASLPPLAPPRLVRISPSGSKVPTVTGPVPPVRQLRRPAVVGGLTALVVALAALTLLLSRGVRPRTEPPTTPRPASESLRSPTPAPPPPARSESIRTPPVARRREAPQGPAPAISVTPTLPSQDIAGAPPPQIATGVLRVYTIPLNARILVDGREFGHGVISGLPIAAGVRHLRITAPDYVPLDTVIRVAPGATVDLGLFRLTQQKR